MFESPHAHATRTAKAAICGGVIADSVNQMLRPSTLRYAKDDTGKQRLPFFLSFTSPLPENTPVGHTKSLTTQRNARGKTESLAI